MGSDENHGDPGSGHRQPLLKLEPAHPTETEVQDQTGRAGGRGCVEKLTGRGERLDGIARRLDQASEGSTDRQIVVDDGDQRTVGPGVMALENECGGPVLRAPVDFGPLAPEPEGV